MTFLHELPDAKELFEVVAKEKNVISRLVEKDYWIMHCLWGLQQQGFDFELKGGTSLSKAFKIIERFSEDIDIQIHPDPSSNVKTGKNHDKPSHIEGRRDFFDLTADRLKIDGMKFCRDSNFDDEAKMRSAGISGEYKSYFSKIDSLKDSTVLELGFDQTTPNVRCDISSWALDKALSLGFDVTENRARNVKCYRPEYTLVEKLQTISTKFRLQQEKKSMPVNFLRHYYDVSQLLSHQQVIDFLGTEDYQKHKNTRFRIGDEKDISKNEAFLLSDKETRDLYQKEFHNKSAIYFGEQPSFDEILQKIGRFVCML